jgi:non-specific serine/threonine protein kinase
MVLSRLSLNAVLRDDLPLANSLSDKAMALFSGSAPVHALSLNLHTAATVAMMSDDLAQAEQYYKEALRAAGTAWLDVPYSLEGLAMTAERGGRSERAVRLFSAAKNIRGSDQLFAEPIWRQHVEESIAALWDGLGSDRVHALAAKARELGQQQAVDYALAGIWPGDTENPVVQLDDGERHIARLVADGLSNRQIADHLGLSQRTVAYRLSSVRAKAGVRSRSDIAAWVAANPGVLS